MFEDTGRRVALFAAVWGEVGWCVTTAGVVHERRAGGEAGEERGTPEVGVEQGSVEE